MEHVRRIALRHIKAVEDSSVLLGRKRCKGNVCLKRTIHIISNNIRIML